MRSIVGLFALILTGCLRLLGVPVNYTDQYIDVLNERVKQDIPRLATSAEARVDLEEAYRWRLHLEDVEFTAPQLATMCQMNLDTMKALAGVYESSPDRAIAFDLQSWRQLSGKFYKRCESVPGWTAYRDELAARVKSKVTTPRGPWIATTKCQYVVLVGTLRGPVDAMTLHGKRFVGTDTTVESYSIENHFDGVVLRPNTVTYDVTEDRDDQLAVIDNNGDPMKDAASPFEADTAILGKCVGTTVYKEIGSRGGPKLRPRVRVIATGAHDRWDWTMWGTPPRRKLDGSVYTGGPL